MSDNESPAVPPRGKILIGTHHKVLTVFFWRVFQTFSSLTARTASSGDFAGIDYGCDVLRSMHSRFDFENLAPESWHGLHVIRDPRDLAVSATHYHQHANEPWLHRPRTKFGGLTYQQALNARASFEDKLLFEIEHSTRKTIEDMMRWDYTRPQMTELRYEYLVADDGAAYFSDKLSNWPLTRKERQDLVRLFRFFSLQGQAARNSTHIRDASPQQWRAHFTPQIERRFGTLFPGALDVLGYA